MPSFQLRLIRKKYRRSAEYLPPNGTKSFVPFVLFVQFVLFVPFVPLVGILFCPICFNLRIQSNPIRVSPPGYSTVTCQKLLIFKNVHLETVVLVVAPPLV